MINILKPVKGEWYEYRISAGETQQIEILTTKKGIFTSELGTLKFSEVRELIKALELSLDLAEWKIEIK